MAIELKLPPILRGDADGGSAVLVVAAALQNPGCDVHCVGADVDETTRMRDAVDAALGVLAGVRRETKSRTYLPNNSRILFREPRRDGKGMHGICPLVVWLGNVGRWAEIEAIETLKRGYPIILRLDGSLDEVTG